MKLRDGLTQESLIQLQLELKPIFERGSRPSCAGEKHIAGGIRPYRENELLLSRKQFGGTFEGAMKLSQLRQESLQIATLKRGPYRSAKALNSDINLRVNPSLRNWPTGKDQTHKF